MNDIGKIWEQGGVIPEKNIRMGSYNIKKVYKNLLCYSTFESPTLAPLSPPTPTLAPSLDEVRLCDHVGYFKDTFFKSISRPIKNFRTQYPNTESVCKQECDKDVNCTHWEYAKENDVCRIKKDVKDIININKTRWCYTR